MLAHTENPDHTHAHTHIPTVWCARDPLAWAAPAPVPRDPCTRRSACSMRPSPSNCRASAQHERLSTILGPAAGALPSPDRFLSDWVSGSGREGPTGSAAPAQSLGQGGEGRSAPGILRPGPGFPPGSSRTNMKDLTLGEVAWSTGLGGVTSGRRRALSVLGSFSSLSGAKGGKMEASRAQGSSSFKLQSWVVLELERASWSQLGGWSQGVCGWSQESGHCVSRCPHWSPRSLSFSLMEELEWDG